jgi:hypothetical protein
MVGFHPLNVGVWDAASWCDTLTAFSEANDLVLVCPDGGPNGDITDQIDYDFTSALIDSMHLWYNIDSNRTYAMGFSMGGVATYEYGLNNAGIFGGYIPIGAAVSGATAFAPIIGNAEGKPYYLVHGALDNPVVRYTPMLNALNANCALVNSLLMTGVGHTINFPNRDLILSDAFFWVDSVNLAATQVNGAFNLTGPTNGATIAVEGFASKTMSFTWTPSLYAPTCTEYTVLLDSLSGNFTTPSVTLLSNNSGLDTALTLNYHYLDSVLNDLGVPIGGSITMKWAVAARYYDRFEDTTKSLTITFTRDALGFNLLTPSSGATYTLKNGKSVPFDWTDHNASQVTYDLLFDTIGGDFSAPMVSMPGGNNGASSSLTLTHHSLYNAFMFGKGYKVNDTIRLLWTVRATDSVLVDWAKSSRSLTLIKGDEVGFELIAPLDNSILFRKSGVTFKFDWDTVALPGVDYTWIFDTINGDFSNPLSSFTSNLSGKAAQYDLPPAIQDSLFHLFNTPFDDTLIGMWTVRASNADGSEMALTPFAVRFYRDFPDGFAENSSLSPHKLYPNPTKGNVTLEASGIRSYSIFNSQGQLLRRKSSFPNEVVRESIDLAELPEGVYWLVVRSKNAEKHTFRIVRLAD